jgi:hypothetical protein
VAAAGVHAQLRVLADLAHEANAAGAEDAALLVEDHQLAQRDPLPQLHLGEVEARGGGVVLEVVVLQLALARLVADGAVDRVVHQQELEGGPLLVLHLG